MKFYIYTYTYKIDLYLNNVSGKYVLVGRCAVFWEQENYTFNLWLFTCTSKILLLIWNKFYGK